jgi:hypothetical protein
VVFFVEDVGQDGVCNQTRRLALRVGNCMCRCCHGMSRRDEKDDKRKENEGNNKKNEFPFEDDFLRNKMKEGQKGRNQLNKYYKGLFIHRK